MLAPIQEHLRAKELAPAEHYVDQAYPSGPELVRQARLGTQIIGPVGQDTSWQACEQTGYAVDNFVLDWQEGRTLTLTPPEVHAALVERRAVQTSPAFAPHALRWAAQNAFASPRYCGGAQFETDRGSSACAIPRQTDPSCASKIVVRSLAGPGGDLMFGHLYRISQQSHKSAPTASWFINNYFIHPCAGLTRPPALLAVCWSDQPVPSHAPPVGSPLA